MSQIDMVVLIDGATLQVCGDFKPEPVVSLQGGQLPVGRAVSSSLAILPTGDETLNWHHEVEIRPVVPAEG